MGGDISSVGRTGNALPFYYSIYVVKHKVVTDTVVVTERRVRVGIQSFHNHCCITVYKSPNAL